MDEPERRRYVVGAVKIDPELRDLAHEIITPEDDRRFYNVIGAEDDPDAGHTVPIGDNVTYAVELTDEEADRFRAASNARYVEPDPILRPTAGSTAIPRAASMNFMRAAFAGVGNWHGRDVLVGLLDGGTTAAVRSYLDATMVAKETFSDDPVGSDEITNVHGCLVAPCLIPVGGKFVDAVIANNDGTAFGTWIAAGAVWCADQGAKVLNLSYGGGDQWQGYADFLVYLRDRGVNIVMSAGNTNRNLIENPAWYAINFSNAHSSISFDEATGQRSSFSCYDDTGSGCAPGSLVLGLNPNGTVTNWSGTSASSPHMARLIAMGMTGGRFDANQMGTALRATARNTGQGAEQQGRGAWSLEAALTSLGGFNPVDPGTGGTSNGHQNVVNVNVYRNLLVKCGNPIMVTDNYGTAPTGLVLHNMIIECANTPSDGVGTKGSSPSKAGLTIGGNTVAATTAAANLTPTAGGHYKALPEADVGCRVVYLTADMIGKGGNYWPWA